MAKYKLGKIGIIGLAMGSFIFGSQILHLIQKFLSSPNFAFEIMVCALGLIIAGISLYIIYKKAK